MQGRVQGSRETGRGGIGGVGEVDRRDGKEGRDRRPEWEDGGGLRRQT